MFATGGLQQEAQRALAKLLLAVLIAPSTYGFVVVAVVLFCFLCVIYCQKAVSYVTVLTSNGLLLTAAAC